VAAARPTDRLVVAIDGPSGSGKSSVSREVARRFGLRYLDTGAMYRAMTWWMLRHGIDVTDREAVAAAADKPTIVVGTDPDAPAITLDGEDVSGPIRTREVTNAVSAVSAVPAVRALLVPLQQQAIGDGGIVVEGRDIGTVVAPAAAVKVYLTAAPGARAERRTAELAGDPQASLGVTHDEMTRRDRLDSSRAASPLTRAADAVEIDTTRLPIEDVVEAVLELVRARLGAPA
jgi:cytidylate kinase